jgi:hypothetical protein
MTIKLNNINGFVEKAKQDNFCTAAQCSIHIHPSLYYIFSFVFKIYEIKCISKKPCTIGNVSIKKK